MIHKLQICVDGKLILNKFSINQTNNTIIINSIDYKYNIIKVPIYNKYNGIDYVPLCFPLTMIIINNHIFNPYIVLSSYNFNIENDIDFFYNLEKFLNLQYNYSFIRFNDIINENKKNINITKLINDNFNSIVNLENLQINKTNTNQFICDLWFDINIIKMFVILILIKFPNISNKSLKEIVQKNNYPKKILTISNQIKNIKYTITNNSYEYCMSLNEYMGFNFLDPLKLADIKNNCYYYIVINKNDNTSTNENNIITSEVNKSDKIDKVIKIYVKKINKNIILLSDTKNILYENYKWYHYHPSINIDKNYIIYQTFISNNFTCEIIKNIFNIETLHCNKIIEYYQKENKLSNLLILPNIFQELTSVFDDINLLKLNSYSDGFFEYITKKYSSPNEPKIYEILGILFENYNYPLKANRHDMDNVFDHLLYFSLYNYKQILINTKTTNFSNFSNEILHPNVNSIIPNKLKNLYINLLKALIQIINNDFDAITYNQKFYYDYLHRNIIKLFFSNGNYLSINLFKSLVNSTNYLKFKNVVTTNLLLIDVANKLSWNNLPKKLNYLNLFYKNNEIIHYQDKINKNIIPDNFDSRIKKVIENPFEMYRYLRKEKDFEKWTKFISDKILQLYHVPISLSSEDFNYIGKMIFLLFNITDQNIKEPTYINFINFCNTHNKLVLDSSRINIKIRECFPNLKTSINLGYLAKHLTWDKESFSFDEDNEKTEDVLALEIKLHIATKKYYKYKAKYLESKDIDVTSALITYKENQKIIGSDTSSVMPGYKKIINKSI